MHRTQPATPTRFCRFVALGLLLVNTTGFAAVDIDQVPLNTPAEVPGNLVLVPSVEWPTVVTHANDPGVAEGSANYSPSTDYAGYFNANLCYAYHYDPVEANRYFYPVEATGSNHSCAGKTGGTVNQKLWSGNFLNWASMQAIDTFRLALTGGYRVHRPADGTPPNVTITGSDRTSVTKSTSEMPNVTYLEKGNSDRWDNTYTPLRRMTANVGDATPSATSSMRMRIGALRNQMWFIPNSNGGLGDGESYNNPQPIQLPMTDGSQTTTDGDGPAMPYDPRYHTLPNADTTTVTNGTACASGEVGCSPATPICGAGLSWNGSVCVGFEQKDACPDSSYRYFRTNGGGRCHRNSNSSSSYIDDDCGSGWDRPTSNGNGQQCSREVTGAAIPQYQRTVYGRNEVYAVSVRVKVCDGTLDTRPFCTPYGNNFKPEGLLQQNARKVRYGLFSYITETGQIRDGGVMRARQKLIAPVSSGEVARTAKAYPDRDRIAGIDNPEWDPATGVIIDNPDTLDAGATSTSIGNCGSNAPDGSQCTIRYSGVINYLNRFGQILTGQPTLKSYDNLSEMYYMALRYLRGLANISTYSNLTKGNSGSDLNSSGALAKYQNADGLPVVEDWYKTGANTAVRRWDAAPAISVGTDGDPMLYQCQTSVILGIGDTSTNNEDDADNKTRDSAAPANTWRGYTEFSSSGGRGNLAGLAYWAHLNDLRSDVPNNPVPGGAANAKRGQTISTFWVDVVERNDLFANNTNQFYNATKYGGYAIPLADWDTNGNAARHDTGWFNSNSSSWTSATQTVKAATGLGGSGNYYLPNNMFLANNGQAMINGLNSAFARIVANLVGSGASLAANSTRLDTGTTTYQSIYYSGRWTGDLIAYAVNQNTGAINSASAWKASDAMPAHTSRNIKTCYPCASSGAFRNLTAAGGLSTDQQNALQITGRTLPQVIDYLRGSSQLEQRNGGPFRNRVGADGGPEPIGDIISSQPVYVGAPNPALYLRQSFTGSGSYSDHASTNRDRTPHIWVAANDGMLHAFNASTGVETFAYMPSAVILGGIKVTANPAYGTADAPHQLFNDGEMTVADAYVGNAWKTILVGTTGRGPTKTVYALDITDPSNPVFLWERSASDGQSNSGWIGQIVGKPVIAQTANGTWSVLTGNGYNSTQNMAALLKFDLASGSLTVLQTDAQINNGLAQPVAWIMDGDVGTAVSTIAYAGDLYGRLWQCDLTANTCAHLFTALDDLGNPQPITGGMLAGKDPDTGKVWTFFGTGRYLSKGADASSTSLQTWYGVIVQGSGQVTTSTTRANLRQRNITREIAATASSLGARVTDEASPGDIDGSGWFMDLKVAGGSNLGERMITPNQFQGRMLLGVTLIPGNDSNPCNPSGSGWIMAVDPFTGGRPKDIFFDLDGDGEFDSADKVDGSVVTGVGFTAVPNNPIFVGNIMLTSFDNATTSSIATAGSGGQPRRTGWRELVTQ